MTLSPDGHTVVVGCYGLPGGCHVFVVDTAQGETLRDIELPSPIRDGTLRFNRAGTRFRVEIWDEFYKVFGTDGTEIDNFDRAEFSYSTTPRLWEKQVFKIGWGRGLYLKDDGGRTHRLTTDNYSGSFGYFAASKDVKYVAALAEGEIVAWRASDGGEVFRQRVAKATEGGCITFDPTQNRFLFAVNEKEIAHLRALVIEPGQVSDK